MTYAPMGRTIYDADSHIMELPDFLKKYADPALREQIPEVSYSASIVTDDEVAVIMGQGGRHSAEHVAAQVALGDKLISASKEIQALGAFDSADRVTALDMLGFRKQLVFATHSVAMPFSASSRLDPTLRYGAARAHNRHMADFCRADARMIGVAVIPLDDPALAMAELDFALKSGLGAAWLPHRPCGDRSPGHVDFDPLWARLAEARVPFVLHVGGAPLQLAKAWMNNGRPATKDWLGGGENLRAKDYFALSFAPQNFLCSLALDGVFDRFPRLRGAVVELGAGWAPDFMRRLDQAWKGWRKTDPVIAALSMPPSDFIRRAVRFTPFATEDAGAIIREGGAELFLFSSDYPHPEGTKNPIERFESTFGALDEDAKDRFYRRNFEDLFAG